MKVSDHLLIRKTLDGQWEAYARLVDKYQPAVNAISWVLTGSPQLAEEMTLQIFAKVYQSLDMLGDFRKFGKWLSFTAVNHCKDFLKANPPSLPPDDVPDDLRNLHHLLQQLPEPNRLVLALRFRTGFSYEELAEFMDLPINTVRGMMYKGTKFLNQKLAEST